MNENVMSAKDAVSGKLAECFVTIEGNRYNFMQIISFESSVKATISEVPVLGKIMKGHKLAGASGEWSGTAHYNQSIIREIMLKYKNTGIAEYFDIQVTNEDPTSSIGRQTVILKDCLSEGGILAKFDADAEYLDEELSGTFDDYEIPEKFSLIQGMK